MGTSRAHMVMVKIRLPLYFLILICYFHQWGSNASYADPVTFNGPFTQGSLVIAKAPPGSTVRLDDTDVQVAADGTFVFGFSRDHDPDVKLSVMLPNGNTFQKSITVAQRTYQIQRIDGLPPQKVTPPDHVIARIRDDAERVWIARDMYSAETYFTGNWIWPSPGIITGVYGSQRILNGLPRRPHFGIDIAAPDGTPVIAPCDGIIRFTDDDLYYSGGTLIIDHGMGVSSTFLHMSEIDVSVGDIVTRGQVIGAVGSTGRSTGAHLDWRINWFHERLDPAFLVNGVPEPR